MNETAIARSLSACAGAVFAIASRDPHASRPPVARSRDQRSTASARSRDQPTGHGPARTGPRLSSRMILDLASTRDVDGERLIGVDQVVAHGAGRALARTRPPRPTTAIGTGRRRARRPAELRRRPAISADRVCSWRNRTWTDEAGGRTRTEQAVDRTSSTPRRSRRQPHQADRARRTASAPGSCSTSRGTGRAGSPRTAPRRRRPAWSRPAIGS